MMEAKEAKKVAAEKMNELYKRDFVVLCEQAEKLIEFEASLGRFNVCFCAEKCDYVRSCSFKNKPAMIALAKTLKLLGYKVKFKKDTTGSSVYNYLVISWKKPRIDAVKEKEND